MTIWDFAIRTSDTDLLVVVVKLDEGKLKFKPLIRMSESSFESNVFASTVPGRVFPLPELVMTEDEEELVFDYLRDHFL